jgi:hypothetical protein
MLCLSKKVKWTSKIQLLAFALSYYIHIVVLRWIPYQILQSGAPGRWVQRAIWYDCSM